jgi:GT2 family glycosyltransferase
MDRSPTLTVVIVSYNTRDLLLKCVGSVIESASNLAHEIIVVDNASSDGSCEALGELHPSVACVQNKINRGFSAACNQALAMSRAPFVLLLNSDARINSDALSALLDCLKQNPRCAAAGCRLIDESGAETITARNFLSPLNQAAEILGLHKWFGSRALRRSARIGLVGKAEACPVDWIEGSCLLIRRAAIEEVGDFDEQFFMYSEDEDLCYRLRARGWSICFTRAGLAFHAGGGSAPRNRPDVLRNFYLGQMLFLQKHRGKASVALFVTAMKAALLIKRLLRAGAPPDQYVPRLSAIREAHKALRSRRQVDGPVSGAR